MVWYVVSWKAFSSPTGGREWGEECNFLWNKDFSKGKDIKLFGGGGGKGWMGFNLNCPLSAFDKLFWLLRFVARFVVRQFPCPVPQCGSQNYTTDFLSPFCIIFCPYTQLHPHLVTITDNCTIIFCLIATVVPRSHYYQIVQWLLTQFTRS